MAFGQASGPPANRSQMKELEELLGRAGFADFREARYPMNFTQRQAGGKFTRNEADEFIESLQLMLEGGVMGQGDDAQVVSPVEAEPAGSRLKVSKRLQALEKYSDQELAAELQSRGWIVAEP